MDRSALMLLVIGFLALLLALMYLGWHARRRRQHAVPEPRRLSSQPGESRFSAELFYVATTVAGEPLNRVAVHGLGFRARASVSVLDDGITLDIPGQQTIFIPVTELRGADRATWTIDRVVEADGLVLIAWELVDDASGTRVAVDSYLRPDAPADSRDLIAAVMGLRESNPSTPSLGGTA
ncbi:hypothetical protein FB562_1053 [Homoserinimonas aerilata]|uniref:PH domain-containing protein n=1 Tax=Homoserinimonas aerilata TaxID=1162970 RepID=A0A542YJ31_9MICO|nr:hypothetical protein [Homoserinimonas aerilata]TQL47974.1 hypothetical protein FB562_1053 [Homoserinimonas aerilata]